jgi:hypothetical protein
MSRVAVETPPKRSTKASKREKRKTLVRLSPRGARARRQRQNHAKEKGRPSSLTPLISSLLFLF